MLFPNEGWESGDFGGWVKTGVVAHVLNTNPRTGIYSLRHYTAAGGNQWGRVTYTIIDAAILAALAGRTIKFKPWVWSALTFGASDIGNVRQITVGDNVGSSSTPIPTAPDSTWQQIEVSHLIDSSPASIFFETYWYKAGFRAIYQVFIDDMESDPPGVIVLPTVTTDPATEVS